MIQFLLHGWVTSPLTQANKAFFQQAVETGWDRILIFPFSQKNHDYLGQFTADQKKFITHNPDRNLTCTMASTDIPTLITQIQDHPCLYFSGGNADFHLNIINQIPHLKKLLQGKIITGNSAWSQIWSHFFFSGSSKTIKQGLNLLNIKLMVHRQSEKHTQYNQDSYELLKQYGDDLPIYSIREQEYISITID